MGCWGGQGGETCGYTRESPSQATPCTSGCVQSLPSAPSVLEQVTPAFPQKETPTVSSPFPEPPVTTVCFLVAYSGHFLEMESDIMWPCASGFLPCFQGSSWWERFDAVSLSGSITFPEPLTSWQLVLVVCGLVQVLPPRSS